MLCGQSKEEGEFGRRGYGEVSLLCTIDGVEWLTLEIGDQKKPSWEACLRPIPICFERRNLGPVGAGER